MTVREVGLRGGVGEDLAAVGAALARFVSRPRGERPGEVVRDEMVGWRRLIDRMELEFAGMVTELAACGEDEWLGHNAPTDWVKEECHLTGTAAWNALVVGQQASRMPESTRALVAGEIGYAHLALMARAADWIGGLPVVAVDLLATGLPDAADPGSAAPGAPLPPTFDERALLSRARDHSVAELRRDCAHLRHAADPRRFLSEQVEQVEARFLELKAVEGGALCLRGFLDSEGGALLRTALEPLARPSGEGDDRSRERRFADALVELAGHTLDGGVLPRHAGQRPHLQVTATLATFQGREGAPAAELDLGGRSPLRPRAGWVALVAYCHPMPIQAAIYCRISKDREGAGLGVDRQEQDCRVHAAALGWDVHAVYIDNDLSAYSGKPRPGYEAMLDAIRSGQVGAVIAWHTDRLHRSPRELETFIDTLREAGDVPVSTVRAGDIDLATPTGRAVARTLGAWARYESEHKSERIRRKHLQLAQSGAWSGGGNRAYGYTKDGKSIVPDEAAVIREAADRVLAGESLTAVAADLRQRGIPTSTGIAWRQSHLGRTLRSAHLSGQREHGGEIVAVGTWPAILTPAQTTRFRRMYPKGPGRPPKTLLSGMLVCGRDGCGHRLLAKPTGGGYRAYSCVSGKERGGCGLSVTERPLDALISAAVIEALSTPLLGQLMRAGGIDEADQVDYATVAEARTALAEVGQARADSKVSTAAWMAAVTPLEAKIEAAERRIAGRHRHSALNDLGDIAARWPSLPVDRRRAIIAAVVEHITIAPASTRGQHFHADRVSIVWRV
jgi:DNA invertase Pin-like site-specific DNA recombinase